ncbi:hypothetical protein FH972_010261 [Carpinus fangiana]|uniref:Protein kinase domain-containing protein n=1 Tax=Carpinus fangiana TaxID=176857 RepID=A0A660KPF2_9ROSI|nr:hypothetical protein FH972_010261 [Carpinus fangiana]
MQAICLITLLLVVVACGQSDFEALLELKKGIVKDPSGQVLVSWDSKSIDSNGCPRNWYGITCTHGRVTSITVNDVGLVGDFRFPAITGLTMLSNLSVSNNLLTGTIYNIGLIQSLQYLDLSRNMFHGLIPSGLVNLKNLVHLNLSSNQFEGIVPAGFGKLQKLKNLDLRGNGFSGDIMRLLSQIGSVVHVDLSSNQFSGSLDLGLGSPSFISSIQYLNISRNSLVGEPFAHDGMPYFDSLEVLDSSNNQLVGGVPPSFNFMVSLRILRLGSNQLTGPLPEALLQESSMILSELDLSLNRLKGPVGSITSANLKKLNLSSNKLSGSLPAEIGHCTIIDLSNNMLSGNVSRIQSWGNYVEVIELSSNSLTGSLPNQTSQFLRLTSLKISKNSLVGALPPVLGTYPELQVIDLSLNQLNGVLLPSLFTSTHLASLKLSGNNLSGSIPLQEIGNTTSIGSVEDLSLVSLDLSNNSLSGHFPPGITFHPGNSLLVFHYSPSSPKDIPQLTPRDHRSRMTNSIRIALIAGLVGGTAVISLMCILIYYRTHLEEYSSSSIGNDAKKGVAEGSSSISHRLGPNKNVDPSLSSFTFDQNIFPSSQMGSADDAGDTSSVVKMPRDRGHPESVTTGEGISSPMALLSPSNPSPSKNQQLPGNPGVPKVSSPEKLAGDLHLFDGPFLFTAEELSDAPAEVIGKSCHGTLYKATLDSGHILAVKWLREGIVKGRNEFAREAKKLGNIKHPNLVSLLGYYWGPKEHEKLIISNYFNAQPLALYLHDMEPRKVPSLSLGERIRVAVEVARCLNYLHNEKAIPHGNLKSTNILLENPDPNVLLTDYSLHRLLTPYGTAEQVLNAGALGYTPPEFASSSKPSPSLKSDVYAFGVILLELLTGKSSGEIISGIPGVVDLTDWVRFWVGENRSGECFDRLILNREGVEHPPRVLDHMLQVALTCILPASERPDMTTVFEDLSSVVL